MEKKPYLLADTGIIGGKCERIMDFCKLDIFLFIFVVYRVVIKMLIE